MIAGRSPRTAVINTGPGNDTEDECRESRVELNECSYRQGERLHGRCYDSAEGWTARVAHTQKGPRLRAGVAEAGALGWRTSRRGRARRAA